MQISTAATPVARMPWRQIGVLALIGILIAAAAVAVGSARKPELLPAPPFGLAENGAIAVSVDGDIATIDPDTGATTRIVTGSEVDTVPTYSPDGTQLAFQRTLDDGADTSVLMVGAADGTGLRQVTTEPLQSIHSWSFSPDGQELLVTAMIDDRMRLLIQPVDGGDASVLDLKLPLNPERVEASSFRPPDAREVLFLASDVTTMRGLFAYDRVSGETRTIVAPVAGTDTFGASWSPTGDAITFHQFDATGDEISARLFISSADGSDPRRADTADDTTFEVQASAVSNDGSRVVVNREYDDGVRARSVVLPITSDGVPVELTCGTDTPCAESWFWSPDDTQLVGVIEGPTVQYVVADPATGKVSPVDWTASGHPAWQRTGGEAPTD